MSKQILVVEDDTGIQEMLVDCLSDAGYTVVVAANGRDALTILRTEHKQPQLILLDLTMPLMGGQQFLETWRREAAYSPIPVVVFTADQREHYYADALNVSAQLSKPVELDTLLDMVGQFVPNGSTQSLHPPLSRASEA